MRKRVWFWVVPLIMVFAVSLRADEDRIIRIGILDKCDPATFNAAFGAGTCVGGGDVTLAEFIAELTRDQRVDDWVFDPDEFEVRQAQRLVLVNRGGETHTFTRVAAFGGGFVPELNALSGNPTPRPECARVLRDGSLEAQPASTNNIFVPAGATVPGPTASGGAKFQCCIHPWMRTTVGQEH